MRIAIFFVCIFSTFISGAQSLKNWSEISFQSQARSGHFKELRITQDSVHYRSGNLRSKNLQEVHECLKRNDKKQLTKTLKALNQVDFERMEAPSNKRAFDGARHSQLNIKTATNQFDHYFDDELPHEKLVPLLKIMLNLTEQ